MTAVNGKTHVLMYHDVLRGEEDDSGFDGSGARRYKLSWKTFVEHLDAIGRAVGSPPVTVDDPRALDGERRSWALTFDDGGSSGLPAGEELARRSWRGHFFVTTERIGQRGFLDAEAIVELRRMGHVIGSHSVSHPPRISSLSADELLAEWQGSVDVLSDVLGENVHWAAVPGGYYSREVAAAASSAGIDVLFTSEPVRTARLVEGCLVIGRFSVKSSTRVEDAASAAAGRSGAWMRQYAGWNLRKPAKALVGGQYERLRSRLLDARSDRT